MAEIHVDKHKQALLVGFSSSIHSLCCLQVSGRDRQGKLTAAFICHLLYRVWLCCLLCPARWQGRKVAWDLAGNKSAPGCLLIEDAQLIPHLKCIAQLGNIAAQPAYNACPPSSCAPAS